MILIGAGVAIAAGGAAAHGTFYRNSAVFGRVLGSLRSSEPEIALTFDDGPNPAATPHILTTLDREQVPTAFFVLGRHAARWPDLVGRVAADGHQLGNHGYFHRRLHWRSPRYVRRDIEVGTAAIEHAAGHRPRFFRAPHGFRTPWVTPIARGFGQRTVGWSLGVWDSACPGTDEIVRRTLTGVRPGCILLLHDGDGYDADGDRLQTARALPLLIDGLRRRGYRFRPLPA